MHTKHTPGQWHIENYPPGQTFIYAEDGSIVCEVNHDHRQPEEVEANARLLAAAPAMLDYIRKKAEEGGLHARALLSEIDPSIVWA